ncbi:MAG TPA: sulfite exporter TauE/SafE family protein [Nocardioides sp.]|nr:sulfite exporter TauE/SafE family protein [Nocardioides sp.]
MATVVLLVALGVAIGLVLGGLGGGGAILTVPALVFLVGQSAPEATTSSLVIVGVTAAVGAVSLLRAGRVDLRTGAVLALVGVPAAWLGARLGHALDEHLLLLGFAVLMVAAAAAMWRGRTQEPRCLAVRAPHAPAAARDRRDGTTMVLERQAAPAATRPAWSRVLGAGVGVGLMTGFFGVGGGFVVVPVLIGVVGLPMDVAAGTSLVVVAVNSVSALAARASVAEFDWGVIAPFAAAAVVAALAGARVAGRLPSRCLRRGFAALLVLVGAYTAVQSLTALT